MSTITVGQACATCEAVHDGIRAEARAAGWQPWTSRTQADIDAGPLVCPACTKALLERALALLGGLPPARRGS